jgi:hypothetical protein
VPLMPEAYKYLIGMQCLVSLSDGLAGYPFPLYNTRGFNQNPYVHRTPSTLLCCPKPSQPGLRTVCAMLNAGWPALIAALSDLTVVDVPGALQTLAPAAGRPRTAHHM